MSFGRKGLTAGEKAIATGRPAPRLPTPPPVSNVHRFDVTPSPVLMAFSMLFFGACAAFLVSEIRDPRGVVINHIITLDPFGADIFFGALLLVALALVAVSAVNLFTALAGAIYMTIHDDYVEGYSSPLSRSPTRIRYSHIESVSLREYQDKLFLKIVGSQSGKIRAVSQNFNSKKEFEDFMGLLHERIG